MKGEPSRFLESEHLFVIRYFNRLLKSRISNSHIYLFIMEKLGSFFILLRIFPFLVYCWDYLLLFFTFFVLFFSHSDFFFIWIYFSLFLYSPFLPSYFNCLFFLFFLFSFFFVSIFLSVCQFNVAFSTIVIFIRIFYKYKIVYCKFQNKKMIISYNNCKYNSVTSKPIEKF